MLSPKMSSFLSNLNVAILLTLDGRSNRNLKGFFVVTAHWLDVQVLVPRSVLPNIINVTCGVGVGGRFDRALFEYLKAMNTGILTCLLKVASCNGSDVTAAITILIQMIYAWVRFEQLPVCNHVGCAGHAMQLTVLEVVRLTKKINEAVKKCTYLHLKEQSNAPN